MRLRPIVSPLGIVGLALCWLAPVPPSMAQDSQPASAPAFTGDEYEQLSTAELTRRAREFLTAGNLTEASRAIRFALAKDRADDEVLSLGGEIAEASNDTGSARELYLEAMKIRPGQFQANFGLGRLWARTGQFRQARNYLETAASVAPTERAAETLTLLAQTYRGLVLRTQAVLTAEKAVQADAKNYDAWQTLALLRADNEEFEQALADTNPLLNIAREEAARVPVTEAALQRLFDAYDIRLKVLSAYQQTLFLPNPDGSPSDRVIPGKEAESAKVLSQVVEIFSFQAEIRYRQSFFRALSFAERVIEFGGPKVEYLLQLGMVQKNAYQFEQAAETFRKVLEIDAGNAVAREQLDALAAGQASPPQ